MVRKKIKKAAGIFNSLHIPNWLVVVLLVCMVLRIPSFFEPYSYGDETTYLTLNTAIHQGKILYKDIFDHKPPYLYYVAALAGNLFWFKAITAFWSFITIVIFWKLAEHFAPKNKRRVLISTTIFALLTTLPLLEGNVANAENFMIGFSMLAFYILLTQKLATKNVLAGGILLAVAALFKVPALFEAPVIVFYWLLTGELRTVGKFMKTVAVLIAGFMIPILITLAWYAYQGALPDFITWGFLINFVYINAYRPAANQLPFLQKNLPLILRGVLTLVGVGTLFLARKKLSKKFIFISIWLFFTLFAITLPERPYPHYLLQATGPLSLLLGTLLTMRNFENILTVIPLTIFFAVPVYYKFWYYSTADYYSRFFDLLFHRVTKEEYLANFGSHIPRDYELAEQLMGITSPEDEIFVWGPESQTVYALSRRTPPIRFVAQFHIYDYSSLEQTAKELRANLPRAIVIEPNPQEFPELRQILAEKYIEVSYVDGARIFLKTTVSDTK